MQLKYLEVSNFRNLKSQKLFFDTRHNFLFGDNAQGKTNIIEVIYILCLAKSFRVRDDAELIPFGEESYSIDGLFCGDYGIEQRVGVSYSVEQGKRIHVDGKRVNQFSQLVGQFPVVVLSSDDFSITNGPPSQRRRFFNILFSQSSTRYLEDLKEYEKILRQRNVVLLKIANGSKSAVDLLDVWDQQLVAKGSALMKFRKKTVAELNEQLPGFYQTISRTEEKLEIDYQPNIKCGSENEIQDSFFRTLKSLSWKERKRGTSLAGPHRDEYAFKISEREVRKFGSRGEHKSTLVSLKAAEAEFLKKKTGTNPILLLDDLYSELDKSRGDNVLNLFSNENQIFVTGTSFDYEAVKTLTKKESEKIFQVKAGLVVNA
jgi:DNA replication and repair protein RecF